MSRRAGASDAPHDAAVPIPADAPRVSVAVAVTVDRAFTYAVAEGPVPVAGTRVLVPFGARVLVGVVRPEPPESTAESTAEIRAVLDILDDTEPSLDAELTALCEWISDYYVAPIGEAYRLALPGLATHADARTVVATEAGATAAVAIGALWSAPTIDLDAHDRALLSTLAAAGTTGLPWSRLWARGVRTPGLSRRVARLEAAGLCATTWTDDEGGSRTELHVRRTDLWRSAASDEPALQQALGRSKQRRALLDALEVRRDGDDEGWVALSELRGGFPRPRAVIDALVELGLVAVCERPRALDPFEAGPAPSHAPQIPTPEQAAALAVLGEDLDAGVYRSTLLHGITGSGKTEVYLQLIARARAQGKGAIVLVPEIALTPQLADRFRARFPGEVAVLHSGLTPRQRMDAWYQIRDGTRPIAIGARSAVFAPVPRLGVIVVDEEHDASFKQEEGVRYHARDVAVMRAHRRGIPVLLGSATPSLETWERAQAGKHRTCSLRERPTPRPLPEVEVLSLAVHRPDPKSWLTGRLRAALEETVAAGDQAILFLNRRGFTTSLVCTACGDRQGCPDCSAPSMTYHLERNRLMCHLCGRIDAAPSACRACGHAPLQHGGVGTERVEVGLGLALPGVRVLRLDRDAARGRKLASTLARFRAHEADVLVGTQMLSKGHDFPGVTLVGILQGDHGLGLPDLRAGERTFQLLTQVAGRAGRGARSGRVIVQAWQVDHPALVHAAAHDFVGFATAELATRQIMGNPPYGHLALVRVAGPQVDVVQARVRTLAQALERDADEIQRAEGSRRVTVLGPVPSPIERIDRRHRWQILLRSSSRSALRWVLGRLRPELGAHGHGERQSIAIVDVDPQSLL